MGINVYQNKSVVLDHTHQKLVDTSVEGNPTEGTVSDINLKYVFRRRSIHDQKSSAPTYGDGNPLVYALKQMQGYSIQPMYRTMLFNRAREILQNMKGSIEGDILVDVPSSKPLCREFLNLAAPELLIPKRESDFLRKRTIGEVLSDFNDGIPELGKRDARTFKSELSLLRKADPSEVFQMKAVRTIKARQFFQPFTVDGDPSIVEGKLVILLDDLVATGSSIVSVSQCLRCHGATVRNGISLLSTLDAYLPREQS